MHNLYTWKSYPPWYAPLELSNAAHEQLVKLSKSRSTVPISPVSVAVTIGKCSEVDNHFREKINRMTTYFLNETILYILIHMEFCYSMTITLSDVNIGIENFAKEYNITGTWMSNGEIVNYACNHEDKIILTWNIDGGEGRVSENVENDDDENWIPSEDSDTEVEAFEGCEHDIMEVSPGGPWQEVVDEDISDDEDLGFKRKPAPCPSQTQIFDATFPPLDVCDYKLSIDEFVSLECDVFSVIKTYIPFEGKEAEVLRDALYRYVLEQLRQELNTS